MFVLIKQTSIIRYSRAGGNPYSVLKNQDRFPPAWE